MRSLFFAALRLVPHRAGNIATTAALSMPLVIGSLALAVDFGNLTLEKRRLQNNADLAAIVAAAHLTDPQAAVRDFVRSNRLDFVIALDQGFLDSEGKALASVPPGYGTVHIEEGRYQANPALAVTERFAAAETPPNAVRVTFSKPGDLYFASLFTTPPDLTAIGTAQARNLASFSIGSRLLSLNGGVLNDVLGGLLGSEIALEVMDYEALLDADISLLAMFDQLATNLDLTAVTYDRLLEEEITVGALTEALAALDLTGRAGDALDRIALSTRDNDAKLPLDLFFDAGPLGQQIVSTEPGLAVEVGLLDILSAAGALANRGQQIALGIDAGLPGIASATLQLAIGEPPQETAWVAVGDAGATVRTAQTRLLLDVAIGGKGILPSVRLPLYLEVAYGEATLGAVTCRAADGAPTVALDARPGIVEAAIGRIDPSRFADFERAPSIEKARIVDALLVKVDATAHAEATNMQPKRLVFSSADIAGGVVRSVSTRNVLESLLTSLLSRLEAEVRLGPLALMTPGVVLDLVADVLGAVAAPLDALVANTLLGLGIELGEADVRVTGASCGRSVLVQ